MEAVSSNRARDFVLHIGLFSGFVLWAILGLVFMGGYQVGWKHPESNKVTVINQIEELENRRK